MTPTDFEQVAKRATEVHPDWTAHDLALFIGAVYEVDARSFGPKRLIIDDAADLLRTKHGWFGRPLRAEPLSVGSASYHGRSGE